MKTYQRTAGKIMSTKDALDILYELRDVLEADEGEDVNLEQVIILPEHIEKQEIINAISSLLYHDSRKERKKNNKKS